MPQSPLTTVLNRFGNGAVDKTNPEAAKEARQAAKTALVSAVQGLLDGDLSAEARDGKGIKHLPNKKLLKLHDTLTAVKEKFGTRSALIDAVIEADKRGKDVGYKARVETLSTPELWAQYKHKSN